MFYCLRRTLFCTPFPSISKVKGVSKGALRKDRNKKTHDHGGEEGNIGGIYFYRFCGWWKPICFYRIINYKFKITLMITTDEAQAGCKAYFHLQLYPNIAI